MHTQAVHAGPTTSSSLLVVEPLCETNALLRGLQCTVYTHMQRLTLFIGGGCGSGVCVCVACRCQMYTGHVTAGGSICLESLTCSGTPGSWQPDFSVESLLNVIVINMVRTWEGSPPSRVGCLSLTGSAGVCSSGPEYSALGPVGATWDDPQQ